ncbi:ATG7 family protein [Megaselia abdita]
MSEEILQFLPFKSFVNSSFWHKLAELKIDVLKLSDTPETVHGFYSSFQAKSHLLEVDYSAFNSEFTPPKNCFPVQGTIYNKNTIEEFKNCNKVDLVNLEGQKFIEDLKNGKVLKDPWLLFRFFILSFADLKCHKYYYWFGFPCPMSPTFTKNTNTISLKECEELSEDSVLEAFNGIPEKSFFVLTKTEGHWIGKALADYNGEPDVYFCFCDPVEVGLEQPSWLLRLYAYFLMKTYPALHSKSVKFLGLRFSSTSDISSSLIWNLVLPGDSKSPEEEIKFVGWETNQNCKMGPRIASMADSMDPAKLAENSVNLNLKLMKWRLLPDLNLDVIAQQKCLLFGAGTLGCGVARNLLSWGFKNITLVDSGKVSFSNPVRQSLYKHEDALSGKQMKATTAADRLKEINPSAVTKGYVMQIPMPGHAVGDSMRETITKDLETIEELVKNHDVIFLLTDSRESRWLPTMLGAFYKKIVINAALGFDSYLVMRHGSSRKENEASGETDYGDLKCVNGQNLACYFCNDVTAPGDSMKDRTLDQQCTVTRPGVSNIASSYAVELLVALLQHPLRENAPAYFQLTEKKVKTSVPEGILGIIPHSIRGMLCNYENILPAAMKFNQCVACSEKVLAEFGQTHFEFLFKAFESSKYLEDLTGISQYEDLENDIIECSDSDF